MKLSPFLLLALLIIGCDGFKETRYVGQKTPGMTPEIFAPELVSLKDRNEFGSSFSRFSREFYFATEENGKAETWQMKKKEDGWGKPEKFLTNDQYSYNDPMLSPNGKKLYFISDRALDGKGPKKDYDIWYINREDEGWSEPINAGDKINSPGNEYYMSFSEEGTIYFSSNSAAPSHNENDYDIYTCKSVDGKFQDRVKLDSSVNTSYYEGDVFVAPDESYLIFSADLPDGFGRGDLYVCFKKLDGLWTKAKNLGKEINEEKTEYCPFVTPDGLYLFYTSKEDIHWVSSKVIDRVR